jgi:hypothetical protein
MTPISKSLEALLSEIYSDGDVSLAEFRKLRDESDHRWENVAREFGNDNTMASFQGAVDIAMHLLHLSILKVCHENITDMGEALVKDAVISQIEYLRAGANLTLKMLQAGDNGPQRQKTDINLS